MGKHLGFGGAQQRHPWSTVRAWLIVLGLILVNILPSGTASADTQTFSGMLSSKNDCTYTINVDLTAKTYNATITCTGKHLGFTAGGSFSGQSVTLGTVSFTALKQSVSFEVDKTFQLPISGDVAAQANQFWSDLSDQASSFLDDFAPGVADVLGSTSSINSDVIMTQGKFSAIVNAWDSACGAIPKPQPPMCEKSNNPGPLGLAGALTNQAQKAGGEGDSQQQVCPGFPANDTYLLVCIPTYLAGTLDLGKKSLVLVGGGVLMALPIGASLSSLTTPEIDTKGSVIIMGSGIFGDNLKIKAKGGVDLGVGTITLLGKLDLQAKEVGVGRLDVGSFLSALASGVPQAPALPENPGISLPTIGFIYASTVVISATDVSVTSDSVISTNGMGGHGAAFYSTGIAPGGAEGYFGGSHGGLGGNSISNGRMEQGTVLGQSALVGKPGPVYDSPFDPTSGGNGGGGANDAAQGLSGAGAIRIGASGALTVDGQIRANGDNTGAFEAGGSGVEGGSGAGGGISLSIGSLAGKGSITANGGGFCAKCVNGFGGGGGGGRIAIRYTGKLATSVQVQAFGGRDATLHVFGGTSTRYPGGTGTIFELKKGQPADGGTLIVNGDGVGNWPPVGDTPINDSWSSPHRTLVVSNGGRALGHQLRFAEVDLLSGGVLTTASGVGRLDIQVDTLHIDQTSRLDMTARGGRGAADLNGPISLGESPGGKGSSNGYGGSHGGRGAGQHNTAWLLGANDIPQGDQSIGATYDNPFNPSMPGAGGGSDDTGVGTAGGGVLFLKAKTAQVDGRIMANGQAGGGPTADDPGHGYVGEGTGAGGTLNLQIDHLTGNGQIEADGGMACLTDQAMLPTVTSPCAGQTGGIFAGGSGGGRIALRYTTFGAGWDTRVHAHGGYDMAVAAHAPANSWTPIGLGGAGTVYWHEQGQPADGGTLVVDNGRQGISPRGETPIADSISSPNRILVVRNGGLAVGSRLRLSAIEVVNGGILSTLPGTHRLDLTANTLHVDRSSRIDLTGRGLFGIPNGVQGSGPTLGGGGSHGGKGGLGAQNSKVGPTYDSRDHPSQPGGVGGSLDQGSGAPGGGVVFITAGTLQLDGRVMVNGLDTNGPTVETPSVFSFAGAGAGGTINITVNTLLGSGSLDANGGDSCLPPHDILDGGQCGPNYGGGGGGRIAVYYRRNAAWNGTIEANGGVNVLSKIPSMNGGKGTVAMRQVR